MKTEKTEKDFVRERRGSIKKQKLTRKNRRNEESVKKYVKNKRKE